MSDPTRCENCKKVGPRRRFYLCPDNWLYFESPIEDSGGDTIIICVCSKECADNLWKPGPGERINFDC